MRLLRLELTDVAGLARAHATFPPQGASVLPAPNEQGKSTLVRALDALLRFKASANRDETRALKPVGRDVPSIVGAEFLLGGERVRLTKHFNLSGRGRGRTELAFPDGGATILGDEAHEAFRERFERHVDTRLHELLLFHQERDLEALAAGDSRVVNARLAAEFAAEGADDALLVAVSTHAGEQFDRRAKDPKPRGELKDAADAVAELERRRVGLRAEVARLPELSARLAAIDAGLTELEAERLALEEAGARGRERAAAALEVERARVALERSTARERLLATAAAATEAVERARSEAAAAGLARDAGAEALAGATAAMAAAGTSLATARGLAAAVRAARARELIAERDGLRGLLADDPVDAELVGRADALVVSLAHDEAALAGSAWRLRAVAARPVRVVVDGEERVLAAGEALERDVVASFAHAGEDWAELALDGPADTGRLARDVTARRGELRDLLAAAAADDVDALRRRGSERAERVTTLATVERALADLLGPDGLEDVLAADASATGASVAGAGPDPHGSEAAVLDPIEAERALERAERAHGAATADLERLEAERGRADERLGAAEVALGSAAAALASAREERSDEVVLAEAERARAALGDDALADPSQDEAGSGPIDVDAARRALEERRATLAEERGTVEGQRWAVAQRAGELEDVDADLAIAADALDRRLRAANAAVRLAERLRSARDAQAGAYREPLRARISTHLTELLGAPTTVELDGSLAVVARDRQGEGRVPWPALSVGAREQLTILTGLAMAELAGDEGVPFLLDDAIVHSDATRAQVLGRLLSGTTAQVIVLTCREELLGHLPRAEHELVPNVLAER